MLPLLPAAALATVLLTLPATAPAGPGPGPRPGPGPGPVLTTWIAPLEGSIVLLRSFDPPARAWLPGHRGVDLAAAPGRRVRAAGAGEVVFAGDLAGRGVVVVRHPGGLRTTYEPVDARVRVGDRVRAGDLIGAIGSGNVHCGREPACLHWGLRRDRDYLDPWRLLHHGHPVLLP